MEYGMLRSGLKWNAYTNVTIVKDFKIETLYEPNDKDEENNEADNINEAGEVSNCYYENPLFVPKEVLKISDSAGLMNGEGNLGDYKFCDKFVIGEDEAVVYLSTSKAAKLQRALKNAGYKKVCFVFNLKLL
ncbi:unnamed protein product [Chilo suppressalis]|uniref:Uncharacterized protein n=1 Tax=Chilo suppressalis TaxID=168631 RepID=A0ABN8AV67_CHISP|nr:unnamed protein product [Chilo suppressalis]